MSMTVKAYLEKENCECEIRRFLVDQGVSSSFTYLTTKIPQVFPSLAGKQFDLFWKDEEGDSIAFSSDDELTEALGFVNDGLFRIYIRTKPGCETKSGEAKHPGVVCDGCEGEIFGTRFKCCVCPDYDLCCKCENSGRHSEHNMFRIRIPGPFWRQGFMGFPPHGPPPHGPPPPYGPHPGPCGPGPQYPPWRGMKRCWRKWMKKMYEQSQQGKEGEAFDCEKEAKEPRKDEPMKESAERQGATSSSTCEDEDSPTEEYLKDVGESVAEMLGPLGIDVNIDVECKGKRKKCTAGGRRGGGGWGRGRGMGWGRAFWGRMANPCWPGPEFWSGQQQRCRPESTQAAEGCCPEKAPASEGPCAGPQTGEEDVPMGSPQRSEQSDGDWMVLSEDREQNIPTASAASQVPPQAPQTPPLHPIPKIAYALEQLMAMGFSNDGSWLTQLVESKDGDLNKILDAVKPHRVDAASAPQK